MLADFKSIAPSAKITVALKLEHPQNWHSYYQNSGGVELSPEIKWTLPPGFHAGPILWPAPQVKDGFTGKSFIYTGAPVFLTEITAPSDLKPGPFTIKADATWQICDKSCINENQSFVLELTAGAANEEFPEHRAFFESARAALPMQPQGLTIAAEPAGEDLILTIEPASSVPGTPQDFVPDQKFVRAASDGGKIERVGERWQIRLRTTAEDALGNPVERESSFSGILVGTTPLKIPVTQIGKTIEAPPSVTGIGKILGGMFLGGLVLNLMPCVFPVIGLKIMGFVQQSGAHRRKIVFHGLLFTLGVVLSFAVLAGVLFAARSSLFGGAPENLNWGYQLQNPWVVLSLMLLMFIMALNMFGLFEMGTSATSLGGTLHTKQGASGSFFSGVLATVVATPCSGPFLGSAIGAAIALPVVPFFASFGAMALGLSLPYLLLSAFPALVRFLPRPGAWMESFKQGMSFLLFATAGYLLWVYAGQIGLENLLGPLIGLTAIAIAAWIYGRWNLPHKKTTVRFAAVSCALFFALGGGFLSLPPQPSALVWEPWSEKRAAEILASGQPIYIDFTAQWCATCQVNKKTAYPPHVAQLFRDRNVVLLKADKTKPSPEIDAALSRLGRTAIPVNVLHSPGKEPIVLPELLTPGIVTEALQSLP